MLEKAVFEVKDFYGGLNVGERSYKLKPNEASYCNNAVLSKNDDTGAMEKIKGNEILFTLDEPCRAIKQVKFSSGITKIVAIGNTKIYSLDNDLESYDTIKTGLTSSTALSDVDLFNDEIIAAKNFNIPQVIQANDTVASLSGYPPASSAGGYPSQIEPFKGRLFMGGNNQIPYEISYCDLLDSTSWEALQSGGAGYFGLLGREPIKKLANFGKDLMVVYTDRNLYILSGSSPPDSASAGQGYFYLTQQLNQLRFNAPFSVVNNSEGIQFFYNDNNFYGIAPTSKYGSLDNAVISKKITQRLMTINNDYEHKIFGCYVGHGYNQVWWWIPVDDSTVNNQLLIYDLDSGGFFPCEDRTAACMCVLDDGTILTGDEDGNIRKELVGYEVDSLDYIFDWTTGWKNFKNYISISEAFSPVRFGGDYVLYLDIFTGGNDIDYRTVEIRPDGTVYTWDDTGTFWDTAVFTDTMNITNFIESVLGIHKLIKLRFRQETKNVSFRILELSLHRGK